MTRSHQFPWVHTQWLSDVLFSVLYQLGGGRALSLFSGGMVLLVVAVILPYGERRITVAQFLVLLISTVLIAFQMITRPVVISFVMFGILTNLLWAVNRKRRVVLRDYLSCFGLFAVWTQFHPGFSIGITLLGVFFLAELSSRLFPAIRIAGQTNSSDTMIYSRNNSDLGDLDTNLAMPAFSLGLTAVAATVVNPYGIRLHESIRGLLSSSYFMNLNNEWLTPNFHQATFAPFLFSIGLILLLLPGHRRVLGKFEYFAVVVFLILALYSRRYIPFFGIVFYVPVSKLFLSFASSSRFSAASASFAAELFASFSRILRMGFPTGGGLTVPVLWAAVLAYSLVVSESSPTYPAQVCPVGSFSALLNSLKDSKGAEAGKIESPARLLIHPDLGGCASAVLWPNVRIFGDDRNEVNGEARYKDFLKAYLGDKSWSDFLDKNRFDFILLPDGAAMSQLLRTSPKWRVLDDAEKSDALDPARAGDVDNVTEKAKRNTLFQRLP